MGVETSEELLDSFYVAEIAIKGAHQLEFVGLHHLHEFLLGLQTHPGQNELYLLGFVLPWKERFSEEHLGKDAASGPHIDCCCVLCPASHDLRGTIPSSGDVVRKDGVLGDRRRGCIGAARHLS